MADNTYTNGLFTITEKTIDETNGKQWLELTISVSSTVRVPLANINEMRKAQLSAERMNLHALAEAVGGALEAQGEDNG